MKMTVEDVISALTEFDPGDRVVLCVDGSSSLHVRKVYRCDGDVVIDNECECPEDEADCVMENYCDQCGGVIESECEYAEFIRHRVGRVVCPSCGAVNLPCNECEEHWACDECPYEKAEIIKAKGESK